MNQQREAAKKFKAVHLPVVNLPDVGEEIPDPEEDLFDQGQFSATIDTESKSVIDTIRIKLSCCFGADEERKIGGML